ncbi:uncharacterized protein LOC119606651 [Lucilia sericata]|uniref:uncharacterized protein LOC119606651 n=1 Tax=Lucilia sericata TaxID=13632 RepID=UPI0018A86EE6|nr:uncharacterized protein LOC119606651 [Lucilia sericata]
MSADKKQNNKKLSWSNQMTDFLIAHYKEYTCLYDKNHEDYNNQMVKSNALNNILQKMHKFFPNLVLSDVEEKIKIMHEQLSDEMSRMEVAEALGNNYVPKLYCYEQLKFLRKHITPSQSKNKIKEENPLLEEAIDVPEENSEGSQYAEIQMPKRIYRKKFRWRREDLKKFIKSLYKYNVLYDSSHKDYLNRELRFIAYKKLLKETRKLDPKITLNDIRDKMRCLRKQYMKEVRLVKRAQQNDEIYEPVLWCFGLLLNLYYDEFGIKSYSKLIINDTSDNNSFTSTHQSGEKITDNESTINNELFEFEEIQQTDDDDVEFDEDQVNLPTMDATQTNGSFKNSKNNSEEVNYKWLGELVVSQLEEISQNYHTEFAWDVQRLIREYISKSNTEEEESPAASSSGINNRKQKRSIPRYNVQEPPSNVSFNISFLYKQMFWNRKMLETFIGLYKENVCLYDMSHENYNNQTVKMHALKNIAQRMKQYLPNLELKDVQDKIKAIRAQLLAEISLIEEAEASGNKYEPNLWCFEQLEFLRDHLTESSKKDSDTKEEPVFYEEIQNDNADYQSDGSEVSLYTELNTKKKRDKIERRFKWERESLILFIKQLERYRVLYDPKHKDYSKQQIRYAAYNKLLRTMKNLHPEITLTEIRGKIRCIRNQYLKELHSLKNAQKRNEPYTPKLWCYDLLDNLYRDVKPKTPRFRRNIDDTNDTSHVSEESFNIDNTANNELLEFEEIHQDIIENEEDYEKESVNIETMDFTQNNDTTIDYECVNSFEYNTEDVQPTKKRCLPKDYCDNVTDLNEITKFEITECHMKQEKNKRSSVKVDKDPKYDWLGELVVSQMAEISRKYHTEFAWDVQCLIRKYVVKSKTGDSETSDDTTNNNPKPSTSQNIVLPRTSNVSFNLSFV